MPHLMKTPKNLRWFASFLSVALVVTVILIAIGPSDPCVEAASPYAGLPLADFTVDNFTGSGQCAMCHGNLRDDGGTDVSIDTHWRSTMMANSARDPFWQAKVSSEITRNPALRDIIVDKCATCHTPMARTQATFNQSPVSLFDDGFLDPRHPLHGAASDGVSCTLCHQVRNGHFGEKESFSGHYVIDGTTPPPDRLIFGPYPNPVQNMMRNNVGFTPVKGGHVQEASLCATCHTLYTPYIDEKGTVRGEFPEQTPYLEWEESDYSNDAKGVKTCQDCHMPEAQGAVAISNRPRRGLSRRSPFSKHYFVGGNLFMLKLLSDHGEDLALTASSADMSATMVRTRDQMEKATARLTVTDIRYEDNTLYFTMRVENRAGHKIPTGFPSRRAWIHLSVTDVDGNIIFESGRPRDNGSISGNAADITQNVYEPHYVRINSEEQVQIYEAIMTDSGGAVTYTLLHAADYAKDNRLLPRGFDKRRVAPDVAVKGNAVTDGDFIGGEDRILYEIVTAGHKAPFILSARFLYQSLSNSFARDLFRDGTGEEKRFQTYYNAASGEPVVITRLTKEIL